MSDLEVARQTVDVIVPTRNNLDQLRACLGALALQTIPARRIHVCVDGSTDCTLEYLAANSGDVPLTVHTHQGGAHRGRAATRNLPIRALEGEIVLFVDSDMVPTRTLIERHLDAVRGGDFVSVGAVRYTNTAGNLWARYLSTRGRNRWPNGATLPFRQFATANAAMSARDFVRSSGFDEGISALWR